MGLLTLLTDFGLSDYYVPAVKGVVLRLAPGTEIVDLSHDVAPGDVEGAAFLLGAATPTFPPGAVHLAVVDPGVGSERRMLVAETESAVFVAPDNGLLTPVLNGAVVRSVERPDLYLPGPGNTFHGRDRFAPVAAHLLRGEPPETLGPRIDDPLKLPIPSPRREESVLTGRVLHIDRFGNLVTDIPSAWLPAGEFEAEMEGHTTRRRAGHYSELPPGVPAVLPGSLGTLEFSLNGASLARLWGVGRGARVVVHLRPPVPMPHPASESPEASPVPAGDGEASFLNARSRTHLQSRMETTESRVRVENGVLWKEGGMTKWEYKIINIRSENYRLDPAAAPQLNQLGEEGWELIAITSVNFKTGATDNIAMVFKRPVPA